MRKQLLTASTVLSRLLAAYTVLMSITACGQAPPPSGETAAPPPPTRTVTPPPTQTVTPPPTQTVTPPPTQTVTPPPTQTVTPPPTQTVTPPPTQTVIPLPPQAASTGGVKVYETTITLPTYPFQEYLVEQVDPVYHLPLFYFNRLEYERAAPGPTSTAYTGVVLENEYLRLTFLPALGGRLYSAIIKATGQEIFYHNPVVKPSRYGPLSPAEANWWLATGGMEWAYPVQEHGYRWGVSWAYQVTQSRDGATITLSDLGAGRVGAEVRVTLPSDSMLFEVAPRLINAGAEPVPAQFWLNAALSLSPGSMAQETHFILPTSHIVIHSRGEAGWVVPGPQEQAPWPQIGAANLSDYRQWTDYLGFFVPYLDAPFMGAYNSRHDLGVARLIEPGKVAGNKLFAFGAAFPDRSYTDDGSQYFEIWGGANTGFWKESDILIPPGGTLQWQEGWWPLTGLGGLTWANRHAAIHLSRGSLALLTSHPTNGQLTLSANGVVILNEPFQAGPEIPLHWDFGTADEPTHLEITDDAGTVLLDYTEQK